MNKPLVLILAVLAMLSALAGQPQLHSVKLAWDPYVVPAGCSNGVIAVYKSTSLGTVYTPYKTTAYFPANRTNGTISMLPGTYRLYLTAQVQPLGESDPSNVITNTVNNP